jgi:hypothetical protein
MSVELLKDQVMLDAPNLNVLTIYLSVMIPATGTFFTIPAGMNATEPWSD